MQDITQSTSTRFIKFSHNYQQQIDKIIHSMQQDIATIICNQLNTLIRSPPSISRYSLLETQPDQYAAFNLLTSTWKCINEHGHQYFFLTSPAGTGKS